jgi:hypothetical protein
LVFFMVLTSFYGVGAIYDSWVGTTRVCNLDGKHMWGAVCPKPFGATSTKTLSLNSSGVVKIWAIEMYVWFDSPTLNFVQIDDGSWNMLYDDHAWHNDKNHTSIKLYVLQCILNMCMYGTIILKYSRYYPCIQYIQ